MSEQRSMPPTLLVQSLISTTECSLHPLVDLVQIISSTVTSHDIRSRCTYSDPSSKPENVLEK